MAVCLRGATACVTVCFVLSAAYCVEKPVTVKVGDVEMAGFLAEPEGKKAETAVVIMNDLGALDADGTTGGIKPYRDIADGLAAKGIAVLRHQSYATAARGTGEATVQVVQTDTAVASVAAVHRALGEDVKVFVLAHGAGVLGAAEVVEKAKNVAGIIVMGSPAQSYDRAVLAVWQQEGRDTTDLEKKFAVVREGKLPQQETILGMGGAWWQSAIRSDYVENLANVWAPLLVMAGKNDPYSTPDDVARWKERIEFVGKRNCQVTEFTDLNHLMAGAGELKVAPAVIDRIASFINLH